jgi:hypothetical protein
MEMPRSPSRKLERVVVIYNVREWTLLGGMSSMTDLMHYTERKPHEIEDVCLKLVLIVSTIA